MAVTSPVFTLVLNRLLRLGYQIVFPKIPSFQLKSALQIKYINSYSGFLWVPHYWAIYVHSGRNTVRPTVSTYLVWFRDPLDDPRYPRGKYPVRKSEVRRLTKDQFRTWAAKNREIIREYKKRTGKTKLESSDYESMQLPMVVAKRSPRNAGGHMPGSKFHYDEGVPFFSNTDPRGMLGFRDQANKEGYQIVDKYVKDRFTKLGILNKKITATLQI